MVEPDGNHNGKQEIRQSMLEAGRLERESPTAALSAYRRVKKLNETVYPGLIVIATILPALATVLSTYISLWFGPDSCFIWLLSIAIQLFLGFYPVFLFRIRVLEETLLKYEKKGDPSHKPTLLPVFMVMANDWLALIGILLFGIILGGPEIWLLSVLLGLPLSSFDSWPRALYYFSIGFVLLIGCSFYLTNLPLAPYVDRGQEYSSMQERFAKLRWRVMSVLTLFRQIPAGWYFNRGLIAQSLTSFLYFFYVARVAFYAAEAPLLESVVSGILAGFMLGQNFWKIQNDPLIENLADLGQIRCLLRMRRWYQAREYIFMHFEYMTKTKPVIVETNVLHYLFWVLQPGWPMEYKKAKWNDAFQTVEYCRTIEWKYPYADLWEDSVNKTGLLVDSAKSAKSAWAEFLGLVE